MTHYWTIVWQDGLPSTGTQDSERAALVDVGQQIDRERGRRQPLVYTVGQAGGGGSRTVITNSPVFMSATHRVEDQRTREAKRASSWS